MSLKVSQGEGMVVITITSNPKSKWPVLCQILSALCHGPERFPSEGMKERPTDAQKVTGRAQKGVEVMKRVLGCIGIIFFIAVTSINHVVLSVLQLCVVVIFFILTIKSLHMKSGSEKLDEKTTPASRSGISQYLPALSPSCSMTLESPEKMKDKLTDLHTALGTVQIMIGVMNITMGCFGFIFSFWIGGVFLLVGIMCVVAVKVSHPALLVIAVILNVVSAALAFTAAGFYSMDLAMGSNLSCYTEQHYYSPNNDLLSHKKSSFESCFYYKNLSQMILGGLDIMMIALSVLQICVSVGFCVLTGKALFKKEDEDEKAMKKMGVPGKMLCVLMLLLHNSIQQQAFNDNQNLHLPANYSVGWMESLDDSKLISDITIPGTHDSSALFGGIMAECQAWSLENQLKAGIRYFDFRVFPLGKELLIMHGPVYQYANLRNAIEIIKNFLSKYNSETVLVRVKPVLFFKEKVTHLVKEMAKNYPESWTEEAIPSIGEVRGKIVFVKKNAAQPMDIMMDIMII